MNSYDDLFQLFSELSRSSPPAESTPDWGLSDGVIFGVIAAAIWAEGPRPRIWNNMMRALGEGAKKTKEGTINAFLFYAMVDKLLEEFRALDT